MPHLVLIIGEFESTKINFQNRLIGDQSLTGSQQLTAISLLHSSYRAFISCFAEPLQSL